MISYAVAAYVPALHRGYIDFFQAHPGALYVLSTELVREIPRLERDIRALDPEEVCAMADALDIFSSITLLTPPALPILLGDARPLVMPDEDVSRQVAETHLPEKTVEFVPVFLRWDKQISTTEFEVPPDRVISTAVADTEFMRVARAEAPKSPDWWRQIGAVIVKDGAPVLMGYNRPLPSKDYTFGPFGDPRSNFDGGTHIELSKVLHAEAGLIAEAARRGLSLDGASLYVTTFPCPVCAKSIAAAGIRRVYYMKGYSLLDAEDVLRSHKVEIVLVQEA